MKTWLFFLLLCTSVAYSQQFYDSTLNNIMGKALWGDIDNDGYLDVFSFGDRGSGQGGRSEFYLYNPFTGQFEGPSATYTIPENFESGSAAFGDYDNDNRLDLFIMGYATGIGNIARLYHNTGSGFELYSQNTKFTTQNYPTVFFADFNNDGNQDILVCSNNGMAIYGNVGRGNDFLSYFIPSSQYSDACYALADISNDGLIDIFVSGFTTQREISIYRNLNNFEFEKRTGSQIGIPQYAVYDGAVAFGDLDLDGDLDFVLTGKINDNPEEYRFAVYKQTSPFYFSGTAVVTDYRNVHYSLMDADGDGDLDLAYTASTSGGTHLAAIDTNNGSGEFTNWIPSSSFGPFSGGSVAWGDYNRDRRPDLIISGTDGTNHTTRVYTNYVGIANFPPTSPSLDYPNVNNNTVTFTWAPSGDDKTDTLSLRYHLFIDSNPSSAKKLISPMMVNAGGGNMGLIPFWANAGNHLSRTIYNVPPGNYSAYVYAIDHSGNLSAVSGQKDFSVTYSPVPTCSTFEVTQFSDNSALLAAEVIFPQGNTTPSYLYFELSTDGGSTWYETIPFQGNPITLTGTYTYNKTGLSPSATYSYRTKVTNDYGTNYGNVVYFETLPLAPSFGDVSVSGNTTIGVSGNLIISIPIDNYRYGDEVQIEYGTYFSGTSQFRSMNFEDNIWRAELGESVITPNGLWFFIKVLRTVHTNTITYKYPSDKPYHIAFSLPLDSLDAIKNKISAYKDGLQKGAWYSYSIPYNTGNKSFDLIQMLGDQKFNKDSLATVWDAYKFTPNGLMRTTTLSSGEAYLIYHNKNEVIYPDHNPADLGINPTLNILNIYNIQISHTGWNLIPWPYLFQANASRKDPSRCGKLWILSQGEWISQFDTRFGSTMRPHGAYAFYAKESGMTLDSMFTFTQITADILDKKNYADGEWEITLKAFDGQNQDACNYFGTKVSSGAVLDDNDEWDPIPLGNAVRVYFTGTDPQQRSVQLSADYHSVSDDRHSWNMVVENRGGKSMIELRWDKMNIPSDLRMVLVDINNNTVVDLNTEEQYTFRAAAVNPFKIFAGDAAYINQEIEKLDLPEKFRLHANYPNPFNPSTTIQYDLKLTGTVTLSIYNSLGQLVRTLVNGQTQTTGTYRTHWDGKDALGRQVASGVYIYRMHVKDISGKTFTKSQKMLLLK